MLVRTRLPRHTSRIITIMSAPRQSYASMVGPGNATSQPAQPQQQQQQQQQPNTSNSKTNPQPKPQQNHRNNQHGSSPAAAAPQKTNTTNESSSYTPKTTSPEQKVYVLTLLTNAKHHQTMTATRARYFPKRLNRLEAHLTLFHALPGSRLDDAVRPTLERVAADTAPFDLLAAKPFRLNKGVAIGLPKARGGDDARRVHARLKQAWSGFLSRQDAGGFAAHYTIMNKVDEERVVREAFDEVEGSWKGCRGTAEGLSLFLYDKGNWVHVEDFRFGGSGSGNGSGNGNGNGNGSGSGNGSG